jgi:hypothetical protein
MRFSFPQFSRNTWILVLLCAVGFTGWSGYMRMQRASYVTNTDRGDAVADVNSPTGYAGGKRWLIVPESNSSSYQWISETQQMLAARKWRVRHIDHENAPAGRDIWSASPYRWWLGFLARCDHVISGRPLGIAVERVALWADPLVHLLLLLSATVFVARQFGSMPGALVAVGLATLFPLAGTFLPAAPDDRGLVSGVILWSVLPLIAGVARAGRSARSIRLMFLVAGSAGGIGLWIAAQQQVLVLAGIGAGGLVAAWVGARCGSEKSGDAPPLPWRAWALAGAATSMLAWLAEFFPSHLGMRLEGNHPLYGLAWIGAGELLSRAEQFFRHGREFWSARQLIALTLAAIALAALPIAMAIGGTHTFLSTDMANLRLSFLPDGVIAKSLSAWIARDGFNATVAATCLPMLLLIPACALILRRGESRATRVSVAIALGPTVVLFALACSQLAWWSVFDVALLAVVAAASSLSARSINPARSRWLWLSLAALAFVPGAIQLVPPTARGSEIAFAPSEVEGLIMRSFAHWLSDHAEPGGAVILAPPGHTTRLCFHGGLRGIGTTDWENSDGLLATVRIVTATTGPEAQALLAERGVTHIVIPSWDLEFDTIAREVLTDAEDAFISAVRHWALQPWLWPLPYKLPSVPGWEDRSIVVLKVTEDTNRVAALARLAEYFVETDQLKYAETIAVALRRQPADLNALVALAHVERARDNREAYANAFEALQTSVEGGFDRGLVWDRRVSLAIVLALGEKHNLAREQVQQCLARIDSTRIRSLTAGALFRLQALCKAYDLPIEDPTLREFARNLVPAELRSRL